MIDGVKAGTWLNRQSTTWNTLHDGQRHLLARIGLTPHHITLTTTKKTTNPRYLSRGPATGRLAPGSGMAVCPLSHA